ncbi:MAG TPA: VCBS repeat-containing protein, partial [Acidimicrobiales bacterium]|nr:VCBS repeat-containing protein [Acidimicrobiales bacterium]
VFLQRNGTFVDRKYMEMPFAYDAALADVDLDGKADLVLSDPSIAIHRSMGAYSFAPPITVAVGEHSNTLVQDVTGDGRPDVVTEKWSVAPSAVELFVQRADGGFAPPTYHPTGGDELGAITAGDFTGDGRPDLAVVDDLGDYWYPETIKVLPGKQDGSFGPPVAYPADRAGDLKAADVNGDGRTDLVVAREWEKFGVFLQQPSGTFGAEYVTHVPLTDNGLGPLVVDDVSGDGRPDAVLANRNGGLTRVRNSGTAPPPATLQAPWSVWTQPGGSPLDGVGTWVGAVNDPAAGPGQVAPAYFFGQLFGFANSSALGMVGLVTQPAGKFAVFNVVEPNGTLRSAVVPFEWRAGRFYFLFVHQLGPGLWGAWAYDQSAASWTLLGSLSLPPTWGKLKGQTVTALLWAGPTAASCSAYPRADVVVHPAIGFAGGTQTTALQSGGGTNPGDCPAQNTVVSEVWSRYQVGTGGRT